jgi:hypothetical protein
VKAKESLAKVISRGEMVISNFLYIPITLNGLPIYYLLSAFQTDQMYVSKTSNSWLHIKVIQNMKQTKKENKREELEMTEKVVKACHFCLFLCIRRMYMNAYCQVLASKLCTFLG